MSSLAYPGEAGSSHPRAGRLSDLLARRGTDVLLGVAVSVLALVLLSELPGDFNTDSWLALVCGRLIWNGGIPHHETLTILSQGHIWVDQQWLSQLASYAIWRVGGLSLLGIVNMALIVGPVAGMVYGARRLGAPFRSVLVALVPCLAMITPSREIRTQEFAIPLFALVVYLLARDSRAPSRRVFWCLPILLLWANLHGTVTLGAGLVALHGLTTAWEHRRELRTSLRAWRRPLALVLGAPLSILITPYGLRMIGYYRSTMADGTLRQFVLEWRPITTTPTTAVALFLVVGVALWSFGRRPQNTTLWEKLALIIIAAGSIEVVRNALFCGLLALMIVPVSLGWGPSDSASASAAQAPARVRALINGTLAALAVLVLGAAILAGLQRSDDSIQYTAQHAGLLAAVERATTADPSLRVMPDDHFADWLLWRDPALAGRMAYDVRFELNTVAQLTALQSLFEVVGPNWKRAARGYRLIILTHSGDPDAITSFLREPGSRVLYRHGGQVVILRSAAHAARG